MSPAVPDNDEIVDALVIGGGPAGATAARLLASWGHRVLVIARRSPATRAFAESLPPSIRGVLAETGMLDAVNAAQFLRTSGNTVWWGARAGQREPFGGAGAAQGYQVFRPDFDRLLLSEAERAGAVVWRDAVAQRVMLDGEPARIQVERAGQPAREIAARFALDCSGRAGVIARQGLRQPHLGFRGQALLGIWQRPSGWDVAEPADTTVETYDRGWGWSVPLSATVRHVGVMIDARADGLTRASSFRATYLNELARAGQLQALVSSAVLERAWACDASVYDASRYAGGNFLLVGDAGSFIEPLSSFGVKKALASAWIAAVAVHTCLTHNDRQAMALEFFSRWEAQVYAASLSRSCDYAREAQAHHQHPFWARRAGAALAPSGRIDEEALLRAPDVLAAFDRIKSSAGLDASGHSAVATEDGPLIRGHEIVLEQALTLAGSPEGVRFLKGVDLLALREVARHRSQVADIAAAYARSHGDVPFAHVLACLSVLVARGGLALLPFEDKTIQ